jgi:hypothetical protein
MSEINPNAVSLEEPTLESQPITQPPAEPEGHEEPEPEGVVEHQGQRMVPVSVLAAERKRVRETTAAAVREKELTPLQAKAQEADRLRAALDEVRPIIDHVRQHGLPAPPKPSTIEQQISEEEAAAEARDLELYDARTGQPDVARARRIIARRRQETQSAANQAAQAAIGPITSQTAQSASKQNFVNMAMQRDANDQPLVDAKVLAELWAALPAELTAHPEVGDLVLNAAIGKSIRTTGRVARPERGPIVSEPSGGRAAPTWQMDRMAKNIAQQAGISEKAFSEAGKTYRPGDVNVIGD